MAVTVNGNVVRLEEQPPDDRTWKVTFTTSGTLTLNGITFRGADAQGPAVVLTVRYP
ncbi:hypothetical protein GCM10010411_74790 [Actinomadura fulvescens]|uniref:Uncharacterized protein n=1 Tax=Actinomadura fulvescens TaxID=46160 RepID=A0ABN3QIA4_9ACTN